MDIQIKETIGKPNVSGFYFAKPFGYKYWSHMVRVSGDPPFLSIGEKRALFKKSDELDINECFWSGRLMLGSLSEGDFDMDDELKKCEEVGDSK